MLGGYADVKLRVAEPARCVHLVQALGIHAPGSGLPRLSRLELTFNQAITAAGVAALADSPRFATLRTLWLRQCPEIGSPGAAAIARSPHAANLTDLNLLECGIGPDGAAALAASPHLSGLTRLQLRGNPLDDASRQQLRERFGDRVELGDEGRTKLAARRTDAG